MPLVEIPKPKLVTEIRQIAASSLFPNVREFRNFLSAKAEQYGVDKIGDGAQHFVFATPKDGERAVSVFFAATGPREAKLAFYLQRIYSTLWPDNFPRMYAACSPKDKNSPAVTIRRRIYLGGKMKPPGDFAKIKEVLPEDSPKSFKHVVIDSRNYGIPLPLDIMPSNYVLGKDGGEYYVDEIDWREFRNVQPFPQRNILKFMEDRNFSKVKKRLVQVSIARIKHLLSEPVLNKEVA
jgi:hypothetical protein